MNLPTRGIRQWRSLILQQEIGREFSGRHSTTVLHSINKIEAMRHTDEALNDAIARLMKAVVAQS